jgi:hypothetical protein
VLPTLAVTMTLSKYSIIIIDRAHRAKATAVPFDRHPHRQSLHEATRNRFRENAHRAPCVNRFERTTIISRAD